MLKPIPGLLGVIASLISGALSIYLAIYSTTAKNTASFVWGASILLAISVIGLIIHTVIDYRDRESEKKEREVNNRMVSELYADMKSKDIPKPVTGVASSVQLPQTSTSYGSSEVPLKLREAALMLAKRYRDFANEVEVDGLSHGVMEKFWEKHPFKELDNIKERIKVSLGQWNVTSGAEWLPYNAANIRRIADDLEKEALQIQADVLL